MTSASLLLNPRIERLSAELASAVPCDPPTQELRHELEQMPLEEVLAIYLQWARRLVRPTPRAVYHAADFWSAKASARRAEILALAAAIQAGRNLEPYLSDRVRLHGYGQGSEEKRNRGIDWKRRDLVLNAFNAHHLHLSPKGSQELLFVAFSRDEATLLLLGDHKSFHNGEVEDAASKWRAEAEVDLLHGIAGLERNYSAAQRTALARAGISTIAQVGDKFVLSSQVSTDGSSADGGRLADRMIATLRFVEDRIGSGQLHQVLPADILLRLQGQRWFWKLSWCDLLLVEENTGSSFLVLPGAN